MRRPASGCGARRKKNRKPWATEAGGVMAAAMATTAAEAVEVEVDMPTHIPTTPLTNSSSKPTCQAVTVCRSVVLVWFRGKEFRQCHTKMSFLPDHLGTIG